MCLVTINFAATGAMMRLAWRLVCDGKRPLVVSNQFQLRSSSASHLTMGNGRLVTAAWDKLPSNRSQLWVYLGTPRDLLWQMVYPSGAHHISTMASHLTMAYKCGELYGEL